jgi:hypothetical protein
MNDKAAKAVLEEVLSMAIQEAMQLRDKAQKSEFDDGQVFALYNQIHWAKEQAAIMGVEFDDKSIAAFDEDKELLNYRKQAA